MGCRDRAKHWPLKKLTWAALAEALTDNYQKLWIEGAHAPNQSLVAEITGIEGEALVGHL